MPVQHAFAQADGVRIFYREAGLHTASVLFALETHFEHIASRIQEFLQQ